MAQHIPLEKYLIETNIITQEQLAEALRLQKRTGEFLGNILLEKGWMTDSQLCQTLSNALQVSRSDLTNLIPESLAATCKIFPLLVHDKTLYLAMENPQDLGAIQLVEFHTGMTVKPLTMSGEHLRAMLRQYYHFTDDLINAFTDRLRDELNSEREWEAALSDEQHIRNSKKRLGDILVEAAMITPKQLVEALRLQKKHHQLLGRLLVELGWVTELEICWAMSEALHVDIVNADGVQASPEALTLVPESLAVSCNIFPVYVKDNVLYLAMENPLDTGVIQLVEFSTGMRVDPCLVAPSQLQELIQKYYTSDIGREEI